MSAPDAGRRAYDRGIDPAIEVVIEERVAATRHMLRSEFTSTLLSVSNKLDRLGDAVADLKTADRADHAVAEALKDFKQGMDRKFYAMAGLVVSVAVAIAAFTH